MSFWSSASFEFTVDAKAVSISEAQLLVGHVTKWDMLYYLKTYPEFRNSEFSKKGGCFFLPKGSEGTLDITIKERFGKTKIYVSGSLRDCDNVDHITKWFERVVALNENKNRDIVETLPRITKAKGWARCNSDPFEETKYYTYRDSRKHCNSLWKDIKWYVRFHILHPISSIKEFIEDKKDARAKKKELKVAKKKNLLDFTTHKMEV